MAIDAHPLLTSERLTLEPLTEEHAAEMVSVLADPRLYAYIGGDPPNLAVLVERYRRQIAGPAALDEQWCNWIVRSTSTGRPVGFVQATVTADRADVAWVIGVDHQHQGFATESALAMSEWLTEAGVRWIDAHIHPEHGASHRVAAALGLEPTGELDDDGEAVWSSRLDSDG